MKTQEEILAELASIFREVLNAEVEITPETRLESELAIDSLRAMEILAEVEDRFDITIPINILNEVQTVRDLVEQVEKLMAEG